MKSNQMTERQKLAEIASVFFKLGVISFGGPAAHIAMMEDEVVTKRKWMTREHFLDLVGATNLIPGPNSTEMTMHCGHERAGWKGLFVAGGSFIFPAVILTGVLAWLYQEYGKLPYVEPFIYGIKPAVIAIIVFAVYRLGKKAFKSVELAIMGGITLIVTLLGVHEIIALFSCGLLGVVWYSVKRGQKTVNSLLLPLFLQVGVANLGGMKLFLTFLKVGALLYGSGYVLFAFLDAELVSAGYLTRQELIDSVAVGQFTPGPVLSTATFIGWQLNGFSGAVLATLGIFLPSFLFVWILNPLVAKMRKSVLVGSFLDAVNSAAVAIILSVGITMFYDSVTDWKTMIITLISLSCMILFTSVNSVFIVLGGAATGYLFSFF